MSTFKPHEQPRRIAAAVLFVWLFATFASWANACLVPASTVSNRAPGHQGRFETLVPAHAHHAATRLEPTDDREGAPQSCIRFCELKQSVVVKSKPTKVDGSAEFGLPLPAGLGSWPTWSPDRINTRWHPRAVSPPPRLPVAIAFLRLTR